ncbi:hypothetical protein I7I48_09516 [Histoplasma ohiense]|nr:hypothetical protein I7I48_09516 [Histoplasma ohiense (nom. inval.)]
MDSAWLVIPLVPARQWHIYRPSRVKVTPLVSTGRSAWWFGHKITALFSTCHVMLGIFESCLSTSTSKNYTSVPDPWHSTHSGKDSFAFRCSGSSGASRTPTSELPLFGSSISRAARLAGSGCP